MMGQGVAHSGGNGDCCAAHGRTPGTCPRLHPAVAWITQSERCIEAMDQWQWLTELPGPALSLSLASAHSHQSSLLSPSFPIWG